MAAACRLVCRPASTNATAVLGILMYRSGDSVAMTLPIARDEVVVALEVQARLPHVELLARLLELALQRRVLVLAAVAVRR